MLTYTPESFDIDIDLAPMLDGQPDPVWVDAGWYLLAKAPAERSPQLQSRIEKTFRNTMLRAQWQAACRRRIERRRATRAPLLSRVHTAPGAHLVACDVSLTGLRASGRPTADILDIEFKIPSLQFPVAARAEVTNFKDANVIPLLGLKFVDIDPFYLDHIGAYVQTRREQRALAA